jgi:hypothetical protein
MTGGLAFFENQNEFEKKTGINDRKETVKKIELNLSHF